MPRSIFRTRFTPTYPPSPRPFSQSSTRRHTEQIKLFAADGPFGLLLARYTYDDARVNENSVTSSRWTIVAPQREADVTNVGWTRRFWQPTNVMSAALRRSYPLVYWIRVLDLPSTERIIYGGRLHFAPSVIKRPIGLCACFFLSLLLFTPARKRVSSFDVRPLTLKHILRKFLQRCMPKLNIFKFGVKYSKMEQNTSGFYLNVILLFSHSKRIDFSNLTCFHHFYKYIKFNNI